MQPVGMPRNRLLVSNKAQSRICGFRVRGPECLLAWVARGCRELRNNVRKNHSCCALLVPSFSRKRGNVVASHPIIAKHGGHRGGRWLIRIGPGGDVKTHAFALLKEAHDFKEVGRARIAGGTEHAHEAFRRDMSGLCETG